VNEDDAGLGSGSGFSFTIQHQTTTPEGC